MKNFYTLSFLMSASVSATAIFIPLLAAEVGASYFEVGLIGMAYGLANFLSFYIFGRLSDMTGRRRIFVKFGFLFAAVIFSLQMFMKDVFSLLFIRALAGFSMGIFYFPLLAFLTGLEGHKRKIGIFNGFGALGWALGNFFAGAAGNYSIIFLSSGIFLFLGFLISLFLPDVRHDRVEIPKIPLKIIKKNWRVYVSMLIRHSGANAVWIIFPLYLMNLGADKFIIGLLLGLNPLTQFFVLSWVGRLCETKREITIIKTGYALSVMVFLFYWLSTDIFQIFPVMVLLAFSWSFIWAGSLIYLVSQNVEKATSTGIMGSVLGLSTVLGPVSGGIISQLFGFHAVFIFAIAASLISFSLLAKE
jgi:DHA1 family quinolone resistance protein-like MFS transporter